MDKLDFFTNMANLGGYAIIYKSKQEKFYVPNEIKDVLITADDSSNLIFEEFNMLDKVYLILVNEKNTLAKFQCFNFTISFGPVRIKENLFYNYKVNSDKPFADIEYNLMDISTFMKQISFTLQELGIKKIHDSNIYGWNFVNTNEFKKIASMTDSSIVDNVSNEVTHRSFDQVNRLEECVRNGNLKMVYSVFEDNLKTFNNYQIEDLEYSKYMTVSGLTIITRSAIKGGVNYILAYELSDTYVR